MAEIKTEHWYPDHIKDIKEYKDSIVPAYDKELTLAWADADNVMEDRFLSTMDASEGAAWEKMLGISSYPGENLEERRAEIKVRCLSSLPFTKRKLDEILKTMFGEDGYLLEVVVDEKSVKITLKRDFITKTDSLYAMVRQIIPADLTLQIIILYNRWLIFNTNHIWNDVVSSTWNSVKTDESWAE